MKHTPAITYLSLCLLLNSSAQQTQKAHHWIGTWSSAPTMRRVTAQTAGPGNFTYRNIVRVSAGGTTLRVELTNEFGTMPLAIGAAHIAVSAGNGLIQPESDHALRFAGLTTTTIPAGGTVLSDIVDMPVAPLSSLAISVYLPDKTIEQLTCHDLAQSTNFIAAGDHTASANMKGAVTYPSWCFTRAIDVDSPRSDAASIVTLGDSITDGAQSTPDTNRRWPDVLAQRLQASNTTANLSALNEGISGNRLLRDVAGPNALARFERDVLGSSGVKFLIVLEGINDIGRNYQSPRTEGPVSAQDLIFAYQQLIAKAHQHGIKIFGGTITPFEGAGYFDAQGEQVRQTVNHWIRTSNAFDGVIDFDNIVRDPEHPSRFLPSADSGDHLHPGDEGYKTMGAMIDLSLFR